jgi:UDP-N-acetyl-D-mannosaminouronate:lipid I N-acetyl-D-mannosaminouronosyltransferase
MKNAKINGIKIYTPNSRGSLIAFAKEKKKALVALNAEKIMTLNDNRKEFVNKNVGYADGIGAVFALRKKGYKESKKIPGCELWLEVIKSNFPKNKFYLIGGSENTIQATVKKLKEEFRGIKIVGFRNGYFSSENQKDQLIYKIKKLRPDIIFVAMGSPKQEDMIVTLQNHHSALYQGLGGSFDIYTNSVKRAPKGYISKYFEWLFRLILEPRRIIRQAVLLKFIYKLVLNKL